MPDDATGAGPLPPHEILEEIGRGPLGAVHRARDKAGGWLVALRILPPGLLTADAAEDLLREVRALSRLRLPHVLPHYAAGWRDDRPAYTMKLAVNGRLSDRRCQFTDPRAAAGLVEKLARGAAAAHAHGLLHGGLSPGAVLFDEEDQPMAGEFVLASYFPSLVGVSGETPVHVEAAYRAPERLTDPPGPVEATADVWSLGAILYELLTDRRASADGGVARPRRLRRDLDRDLEAVVLRCLERRPADRYASARALAEDLERWQKAEPTEARPATWGRRLFRGLSASAGLILRRR